MFRVSTSRLALSAGLILALAGSALAGPRGGHGGGGHSGGGGSHGGGGGHGGGSSHGGSHYSGGHGGSRSSFSLSIGLGTGFYGGSYYGGSYYRGGSYYGSSCWSAPVYYRPRPVYIAPPPIICEAVSTCDPTPIVYSAPVYSTPVYTAPVSTPLVVARSVTTYSRPAAVYVPPTSVIVAQSSPIVIASTSPAVFSPTPSATDPVTPATSPVVLSDAVESMSTTTTSIDTTPADLGMSAYRTGDQVLLIIKGTNPAIGYNTSLSVLNPAEAKLRLRNTPAGPTGSPNRTFTINTSVFAPRTASAVFVYINDQPYQIPITEVTSATGS